VFYCRLSAVDLVRLRSRLYDVIDLDQDQVLFILLYQRCADQIEALGRQGIVDTAHFQYIFVD
jgi:CRISPR-associated protein Cas2